MSHTDTGYRVAPLTSWLAGAAVMTLVALASMPATGVRAANHGLPPASTPLEVRVPLGDAPPLGGLRTPFTWNNLTVDAPGDVGSQLSVDVTPGVQPLERHVAYYDADNADLKYALRDPMTGTWSTETVLSAAGDDGNVTSIVVEPSGQANIFHYEQFSSEWKHSYGTPGSWTHEVVENLGAPNAFGHASAAALTPTGFYLAYPDVGSGGGLHFARKAGGWTIGTHDAGVRIFDLDMVIDDGLFAHIAYVDSTSLDLIYAVRSPGGAYSSEIARTDVRGVGLVVSIALDDVGRPHIMYARDDGGTQTLGHAWKDGTWQVESVDVVPAQYPSLRIDGADDLHVAYQDGDLDQLKYANNSTGSWEVQTVTPMADGFLGTQIGLLLDDGSPSIVWSDLADSDLEYATPQLFSDQSTGPLGDVGEGLGVAWGDYDGDGDADLYITNDATDNKLLRNDGGGVFVDVTSGPLGDPGSARGSAWADYDNDGDLDLYNLKSGANVLLRNDGGAFVDVTSGDVGDTDLGISAAWADYDNDGDLDVYSATFVGDSKLFRNVGGSTFIDIGTTPPNSGGSGTCVSWADYDGDGDLDFFLAISGAASPAGKLIRNDGGGTFFDATAGIPVGIGAGRGVSWGDYDNDGDFDLYLALNSTGGATNQLFRNDGGGTFTDVTSGPLADVGGNANSVAWGDYDNDGDLDIYLVNESGNSNRLFRNDGGGTFVDATSAPLDDAGLGIGGAWADYDNDGDLDFYVANGGLGSSQANKMFRNDTVNSNNWVQFKLQGTVSNRDAVGTEVSVTAGGVTRLRQVEAGSGYSSQNDLVLSFGLGSATVIDAIEIRWPSGQVQMITPPAVNTRATVVEPLPFVEDTSISMTGGAFGAVAWGDYDSDGDLDILVTGLEEPSLISKIYENNGGTFTDIGAGLTGVYFSSVAWGDYDNDGDLDVLLAGSSVSGRVSKIYENDGGTFTDIGAGLTPVSSGSVAWGDYDNDGDLDVLLSGVPDSGLEVSKIYENDGGTFTDISAGLTPVSSSSVAWGDYDNDGDLDVLLAGFDGSSHVWKVYENNGGVFSDLGPGLTGVATTSAAWGDYDNDGDLDILLAGSGSGSRIFENDGGTFTDIGAGLPSVSRARAAWGDFDNDGDPDVLLASNSSSTIYRNDSGTFTDIGAGLSTFFAPAVAWGDYDNDGDLDILLTGDGGGGDPTGVSKIYENTHPTPNNVPSPPTGLSATWSGSGTEVTFSWDAPSGDETPAAGLSYNLRVGTTPGGNEVTAAMADSATGYRHIPALGNANQNLSWTLSDVPSPLYWTVQAIDAAFAGSSFAPEETTMPLGSATIDWIVGPTATVDENDIITSGTFVHAGTWGTPEVTVNVGGEDIVFEDRGLLPAGDTDGEIGANGFDELSFSDAFIPPGAIDPGFHTVLDGFTYNSDPFGLLVVTLDGLEIGRTYQVQLFVTDDRGCCTDVTHRWMDAPSGGNETAVFTSPSSSYVVGRFTAEQTTQQIYQESSHGHSHIFNAYVLRDVTAPLGSATINWIVGPTTTVDENDIITNGAFVHAGTWGTPEVTVNVGGEDIVFEDRGLLPAGDTDGEIGANGFDELSFSDAFIPSGAIDPGFHTVLDGFTYDSTPFGQLVVTLDGLEIGKTYHVQLFVSDDRACCTTRLHEWMDAPAGGNVTGPFTNGSSSYVVGEFTAEQTTQQIYQTSDGNSNIFNAYVLREVSAPSSADDLTGGLSLELSLAQNHPNPFGPSTRIRFAIPSEQRVTLRVYDSGGRLVRTLEDGLLAPQVHVREWDGQDRNGNRVSSGVYFSRLDAGGKTLSRRMVLVR